MLTATKNVFAVFLILLLAAGCASAPGEETMAMEEEVQNLEEKVRELEEKLQELEEENKTLRREKGTDSEAEAEAEEIREAGLVSVEEVRIVEQSEDHKTLYPDMIQAIINNNSDETIRKYELGFLAYDKNGYPVRIKWRMSFSDGAYEKIGVAEDANVPSGETYGEDMGWGLDKDHNIHYVLGKVRETTFYDGSTWKNPKYSAWRNKYIEKPLPEEYMD